MIAIAGHYKYLNKEFCDITAPPFQRVAAPPFQRVVI